jgi:GNAT superfamily N-acetyltransferase
VFGYRVGTHRYTDLPRDIGDTEGLDVVFSRGPYRGQLPDPRSTIFEVQVDLRYDARSRPPEAEALPLADGTNFPDVLRIAEATLTGHRWGRDPRLAPRAREFYREWLTAAHERGQVHVIPGGFVVIERSAKEHRLSLIAIDPAYQHRGYGRRLVKFFLGQQAAAHRVKTWIDNVAALNLYCQSGFLVESVECVEHVWLR